MKLSEIMCPELILPELHSKSPRGILLEFSNAIEATGKFHEALPIFERLYDREQQESTGIGNGLAIPHCKLDQLPQVILAVGYSEEGVDFNAADGKPTHYFFLVVSPSGDSVMHLRVLAALSRLLKSPSFQVHLTSKPNPEEFISFVKEEEERAAVAS
jgi:mannitol/fructose-specific phosphotransferase system IIA component (Ntr-type)